MTIKEACIKVLTELGGRAPLKIICMKVQETVTLKGATPYNSICTELITHPNDFRRTPGKKGLWELTSYQEEMAELKQTIKEKNDEISFLISKIEMLEKRPTVEEFIRKLVKATKSLFKIHRAHADYIRQALEVLGFTKDAEELASWIEHQENRLADAVEKMAEKPAVQVDIKDGAHAQISEQSIVNQHAPEKSISSNEY